MHNSTDTAIPAKTSINAQMEKIPRIIGKITQEGIDNLDEQILVILVGVKSDHFGKDAPMYILPSSSPWRSIRPSPATTRGL